VAISATVYRTASCLMPEKKPKRAKKGETAERGGKLSLYGLSVEDALRAAAKTGRPDPIPTPNRNRQRKKRTKPAASPNRPSGN
jgi:hypothetical protein